MPDELAVVLSGGGAKGAFQVGVLDELITVRKVKIDISARYKLADAVQVHKDLEARKTTGSTVLVVG